MKQYLDDRLYPVHQGQVIQGTYRGRSKRIWKHQRAGACLTRRLSSSKNGWHCVIISVDGIETYRTKATRDRTAALALLQPVR